jgi:hypothetical protein
VLVVASTILSGCTVPATETISAYVENLDTTGTTGDIQVEFTLVGDTDAQVDLKIQYCPVEDYINSGHEAYWFNATMRDSSGGSYADLNDVSPDDFVLYWDTVANQPTASGEGYVLRVMPGVDGEDYSDVKGPIYIDNAFD